MTQEYYSIITNAGLIKNAAASGGGSPVNLTHLAVGDSNGTPYNPTGAATALHNEKYRTTLTHVVIDEDNPNQLIVEAVINETVGPFYIREVGIFDEDGELFAIGKYPETFKPDLPAGSGKRLYIRMILGFASSPNVELIISDDINNDPNFSTDVNNALAQRLVKTQNLSDLSDLAVARNNLNVYSKSEINSLPKKNYIINGNFDFWQRGSSTTTNGVYLADRFVSYNGDGVRTYSRGTFAYGQTEVPNNPKYYLRHQQTTPASISTPSIHQRIEDVRTLSGQTATLSFYAKVASGTVQLIPRFTQNFGSGGSAGVNTDGSALTITSQWQKFIVTVNLPSISGKTVGANNNLALIFGFFAGVTFDFYLAQIQLEKGSVATDFQFRHVAEELVLCQRFYEKSYDVDEAPGTNGANGKIMYDIASATVYTATNQFKTTKRSSPSMTIYDVLGNANCVSTTAGNNKPAAVVFVNQNNLSIAAANPADRSTYIQYHFTADAEL